MNYTGVELFMENLKQMIYSNDNPLIVNHPSILSKRPRFQLLYKELESIIVQTLLVNNEGHELQQVKDLKKRFKDAAEDAHDIIDLFVSDVNLDSGWHQFWNRCKMLIKNGFNTVVRKEELLGNNLDDIMASVKSIKEELVMLHDNMRIDSSVTADHNIAGPSHTKNPSGTKKASEDIVVGFDRHVELIRDKLYEDHKQLDVVSIVGMGGVGKTTLATKVFNDPFFKHHFRVRGWVTVSDRYEKRDLLIQILESIGNKRDEVSNHDYPQLRLLLRQRLMGKRYLIGIDDVWSSQAWDAMKLSFPDVNNGSRILLTSRLNEVASHAKSNGFVHRLECLTEEESWELLRKKVFHGTNSCPEWLVEPGMKIAKNCHGLPLTLVVVAGVLAKEPLTKPSWERIGKSMSSYIVDGLDQLGLSIDHLPGHLRDCFLYLGGFPEDYKFEVSRVIWLWMAEGFVVEDGHRSLEEIGEDCVVELVDRNLVTVAGREDDGGIKAFYVHDLLREVCLKIAAKEKFFIHKKHPVEAYKQCQRRVFIDNDINIDIMKGARIRSLLCFNKLEVTKEVISKWSHVWMLLMVLDMRGWKLNHFPSKMSRLVHLRYLAISLEVREFPEIICRLWSLQTLVIKSSGFGIIELPKTISNLVNLRHLLCSREIWFPAVEKPMMNLQEISRVWLRDRHVHWVECFPGIEKLSCISVWGRDYDLESLASLKHLQIFKHAFGFGVEKRLIGLPSLRSLELNECYVPWSEMSIIQALPNLEVLKLLLCYFDGPLWDAGEEQFRRLKFLRLELLDFKKWEASSINFPLLNILQVNYCNYLEEIPLDLVNIPTLELIEIYLASRQKDSLVESVNAIEEERLAQGNSQLKIIMHRW